MRQPWLAYLLGLAGLTILLLVTAFIYSNLMEYFGSGPPYYGRTTNMDKWENPVPFLLGLGIPGLLAGSGCLYRGWKLWRHR